MEINPLSVASFANIFSHSEVCLFVLFTVSYAVQKLSSFIRCNLFIFVFISISLGGGSKRILLWFLSYSVLPKFSSKSLIVPCFTFRCLIHFEFIFVYGVRKCSNFILLQCRCPVFPAPLIEEAVFSPLYILTSFIKDSMTNCGWVYLWSFYPVSLIFISVSVPVPYCLDYCSFVV